MTGDSIWLDEEQQKDWRASVVGMTYLLGVLSRDLEVATGLSMPEYEILVRLSEAPDWSVRMSELAEQVAHSRSRVTHTVTRLEAARFAARFVPQRHRRCDDPSGLRTACRRRAFSRPFGPRTPGGRHPR